MQRVWAGHNYPTEREMRTTYACQVATMSEPSKKAMEAVAVVFDTTDVHCRCCSGRRDPIDEIPEVARALDASGVLDAPRWIPVSERPKDSGYYWTHSGTAEACCEMYYSKGADRWERDTGHEIVVSNPDVWQPLPEPPEPK